MTLRRDARPACDPNTLMEACVGGCGRPLHRQTSNATNANCRDGHPAHIGRGLCSACRLRARDAGKLDEFTGHREQRSREHEHALDEWAHVRGSAPFDEFGPRVGLNQSVWVRLFHRASAAGDPRATRSMAS